MTRLFTCLVVCILSACSTTENTPTNASALSPDAMLEKIHAAGDVKNELVFQALPDEALVDLRDAVVQAQANGDYTAAQSALEKALQINAQDPELMQLQAELAIHDKAWQHAEQLALHSYALGPKLGGLCRRNWLTVHYAQAAQGHGFDESRLAKHLAECTVAPAVRM